MPHRDTPWAPGTPSWVDLSTSDQPAAIEFYAALFGWQITEPQAEFGGYANATLDGRMVCGIAPAMSEGQPTTWTTYLATADAAATTAAVEKAGGSVISPAMDVMDLGTMAIVAAPDGGAFGVWQAGTHLGFGVYNEPGALVWNEYLAGDYAQAKTFYADAFGYGLTDMGGPDMQYSALEVDGETVGGLGALPAEQVAPGWRIYFSVADVDAAVETASGLGATVIKPLEDSPFGRWSVLADPQGAQFVVITPPSGG